jgi:hypothetical protein
MSNIENFLTKEKVKTDPNRIHTNIGIFDKTKIISANEYGKVTHMKIYGTIMKTFDLSKFVNLEMLDVTAMDFVEVLDPFRQIKALVEKTPVITKRDDNELLKLCNLKKLKCLVFTIKKGKTITEVFEDDYTFLENLPPEIEEIVITKLTNSSVKNLNFQNIPTQLKKIILQSAPIGKSPKLTDLVIQKIFEYKLPLNCSVYLDNVKLEN